MQISKIVQIVSIAVAVTLPFSALAVDDPSTSTPTPSAPISTNGSPTVTSANAIGGNNASPFDGNKPPIPSTPSPNDNTRASPLVSAPPVPLGAGPPKVPGAVTGNQNKESAPNNAHLVEAEDEKDEDEEEKEEKEEEEEKGKKVEEPAAKRNLQEDDTAVGSGKVYRTEERNVNHLIVLATSKGDANEAGMESPFARLKEKESKIEEDIKREEELAKEEKASSPESMKKTLPSGLRVPSPPSSGSSEMVSIPREQLERLKALAQLNQQKSITESGTENEDLRHEYGDAEAEEHPFPYQTRSNHEDESKFDHSESRPKIVLLSHSEAANPENNGYKSEQHTPRMIILG